MLLKLNYILNFELLGTKMDGNYDKATKVNLNID